MNPLAKLFNMAQEAKASENAIKQEWDAYEREVELAGRKYLANLCLPGELEMLAKNSTDKIGANIL